MDWLTKLKGSFVSTGDIQSEVRDFLLRYDHSYCYKHSVDVALEAKKIARKFSLSEDECVIAGYLHDISAVIPNERRVEAALEMGVDVLPEERAFPLIVHQKLSVVIAKEVFGIKNNSILSAIGCHTTLKKNSNSLDLALFVADKIKWDQKGTPPYKKTIENKLEVSLEHAAFSYISYLYERKEQLKVIHPWLLEAYYDLCYKIKLTEQ